MKRRMRLILFAVCVCLAYGSRSEAREIMNSVSQQNEISDQALWNKIADIVANRLTLDKDKVVPDARFIEDLGADDLDMVTMVLDFESTFNVNIPDDEVNTLKTVGDAYRLIKLKMK